MQIAVITSFEKRQSCEICCETSFEDFDESLRKTKKSLFTKFTHSRETTAIFLNILFKFRLRCLFWLREADNQL